MSVALVEVHECRLVRYYPLSYKAFIYCFWNHFFMFQMIHKRGLLLKFEMRGPFMKFDPHSEMPTRVYLLKDPAIISLECCKYISYW